jgi:hypothetical protein
VSTLSRDKLCGSFGGGTSWLMGAHDAFICTMLRRKAYLHLPVATLHIECSRYADSENSITAWMSSGPIANYSLARINGPSPS